MKKFLLLLLFACSAVFSSAQSVIGGDSLSVSYGAPKEYTLVKVNVVGTVFVNPEIVVLISGLPVNDKIMIPGEKTADAIDNLWREGIFEDVAIGINIYSINRHR